MDSDEAKQSDQFDGTLPLPVEARQKSKQPDENPAADLIRKKVAAAYADEPSAAAEASDLEKIGQVHRSKHQQFIYELTGSGRPLHEIQQAWHDYYIELPEVEKHAVWQEFYSTHAQAAHTASIPLEPPTAPAPKPYEPATSTIGRKLYTARRRFEEKVPPAVKRRTNSGLKSLLFGVGVGLIAVTVFLFSFFNERVIAPFIQPSRNVSNTPIINTTGIIGPNPEIIIPKINVQIPVVYGVASNEEPAIQQALEDGVVHYANTAMPGELGNIVIVGHSSNNIFNPGKYKFAFVLLSKLEAGDTFYLHKDGKRYTYQVYKKQVVGPAEVSVLGPADKPSTVSLITCDPPGTSTNRLVVVAEQIDPNPSANIAGSAQPATPNQVAVLPGNAPSLWSRILKWLTY